MFNLRVSTNRDIDFNYPWGSGDLSELAHRRLGKGAIADARKSANNTSDSAIRPIN